MILTIITWIIILFTILIKTTIIPSIFPYPSYISAFFLLILAIILFLLPQNLNVLRLHGSKLFILILGTYFLFAYFGTTNSIYVGDGQSEIGGIILLYALLGVVLCLSWSHKSLEVGIEEGLKYLLYPYIYFSLFISITGIVIWFLLTFGFINPLSHAAVLSEITGSRFPRTHIYSFPFKLNIAEFQSGYKFLSYPIIRMSGFSQESHEAGLFVTPVLFCIHYSYINSPRKKQIFCFLISLFLFLTFSATVWLILYICLILYTIKRFGIVGGIISGIGLIFLGKIKKILLSYAQIYFIAREVGFQETLNRFYNAFLYMKHFWGQGVLIPDGQVTLNIAISFGLGGIILLYLHYIIVLTLCIYLYFSRRKCAIMGLGPISIILHLHKGGPFDTPFYFYTIYMTVASFVLSFYLEQCKSKKKIQS